MTEEKCYTITLPEQPVSSAIIGGGKSSDYFAETMLRDSRRVRVSAQSFGAPSSLQQIQDNYLQIESSPVDVEFD
jgi:hypothetical protein